MFEKRASILLITHIIRWLGGSDAELEDAWRWVGSGNAFDYTNWARDYKAQQRHIRAK